MPTTERFAIRWGPAIATMAIIFLFSSIPKDMIIPNFGLRDFEVKKGAHLLMYGALANTYLWGITGWRNVRPVSCMIAILWAAVYGVSDELHQSIVPGRVSTIMDVGIDTLGATLGIATAWWWIRRLTSDEVREAAPD